MSITISQANFEGLRRRKFSPNKQNSNPIAKAKTNIRGQYNTLMDASYGRSLINGKNISFGANLPLLEASLSKKIFAGVLKLKNNEVLLIGKDFDTTRNLLRESIGSFPEVIKKILFIEDDKLTSTFAIRKNNLGYDHLMNLGKDAVLVKATERDDSYFLKKGEEAFLIDGDEVFAQGKPFTFNNNPYKVESGLTNIQKQFVKEFDLSKFDKGEVKSLNLRYLDLLENSKKIKEAKKITFADIGGQDEAIAEMQQKIIRPVKYPNFFRNYKTPKTILLIGPPGNAKTLSAHALANELGIPFFETNGQRLEGMYVGESAKNIHNYYENARKNQPCLMFFDEMEATFGKRTGQHKYADDSVNMHLDELSKLEKENAEVYIVGASNRPELIDEAALRDGRFGTQILFKNPDYEGCKKIFGIHTKAFEIQDINVDEFAKKLHDANLSGANIAGIAANAKLNAIERLGIFEAMDKGTFVDDPNFKLILKGEDFEKALLKKIADNKTLDEYAKNAKQTRKDEIKEEFFARNEVSKELAKENENKKPVHRIGYGSELYKTA